MDRLSELAKKIRETDKCIIRAVAKGENTYKLKKQYIELRDELKEILGNSFPIHSRDPEVRKTLKKVIEGEYLVDKEERNFLNFFKNLSPEQEEEFYKILENSGIDIKQISERISESATDPFWKFVEEIPFHLRVTPDDYFQRKNNFFPPVIANPLPPKIPDYFEEIKECFLFNYLYAATGLCRVLIELSFNDKYNEFGFAKKSQPPKVYDIHNIGIHEMINIVCSRPGLKSLKAEAKQLYREASNILHGRESTIKLNETEVLEFIRRVFKVVEALYS